MSESNKTEQNKKERGFKRKVTLKNKIVCTLLCLFAIFFVFWMSSGWPLVFIPFIIDVYWTKYIPWTWWHDIKNGFLREIMSWVDAIVFATVAVWILQNFFFQNFMIPTTSLEKTMLAGDYLMVSKFQFGPRVPMTPLSLPLFQHTITIGNMNLGKCYLEHPQNEYRRMPGLSEVERGGIVVFNYPNGDSIIVNSPETDYYQNKQYLMGVRGLSEEQFNKAVGPVICRPVDRRENYVKRCVGLPGDTLKIVDRQVCVNGEALKNPSEMQQMRLVYTKTPNTTITNAYWHNLGIYTRGNGNTLSADVDEIVGEELYACLRFMKIAPDSVTGKFNHLYRVNLTDAKAATVAQRTDVEWVKLLPLEFDSYSHTYPNSPLFHWSQNNYGPIWIPQRGETIVLNPENEALYGRCIRVYEKNTLKRDGNGGYLLNGESATSYTFKMDYYWMMGDNRDNSLDSRYWGFVPEDHIVGTPILIYFSIDQETGEFRWDRLLKRVHESL